MAPGHGNKKRPIAATGLTRDSNGGESHAPAQPPAKQVKFNNADSALTRAPPHSYGTPPSSGSSSIQGYGGVQGSFDGAPARSQASQFRQDEDGGNDLIDNEERFEDLDNFVLYGMSIFLCTSA